MTDYKPVSCDFHDELTAASTKGSEIELTFEMNGETQRKRGKVRDVYTADGEEFVRFETPEDSLKLRLDQLREMRVV
ncbi:MAG: transcriptional antiterminator [Thermoanaerobaculia bacterium]|nr:transcriptional antiterminator [Thermoanaerobaculia bacterium]